MKIEKVQEQYSTFCQNIQSVILGTVDSEGLPAATYTPYAMDAERNIYIFVSRMTAHTKNMIETPNVSALFLEDEADTKQIYARARLSYNCTAEEILRETPAFEGAISLLLDRHGNIVQKLTEMGDFHLFKLEPQSGRFVVGFGAAYQIAKEDLNALVHLRGDGGQGHVRPAAAHATAK